MFSDDAKVEKISDTMMRITPASIEISLTDYKIRRARQLRRLDRVAGGMPLKMQNKINKIDTVIAKAEALGVVEDPDVVDPIK